MLPLDQALQAYERQKQRYEPKIARLGAEADELARQFKDLYQAASDAFSSDSIAEAKTLSLEAKEIEGQCRRLNAEANTMRQELAQLRDEVKRQRDLRSAAKRIATTLRAAGRDPSKHSPYTSEPSRPHQSKAEPREHVDIYHFDDKGEKIKQPAQELSPGTVSHVVDPDAVTDGWLLDLVRDFYDDLHGGKT